MNTQSTLAKSAPDEDLFLVVALCPLIAASDTIVSALSLGIATALVGVLSASVVALMKRWIDEDARLVSVLLVTASVAAIVELAMRAWFHVAYNTVGVFAALIVCNLALVHRMCRATQGAGDMLRGIAKLTMAIALVLLILGVAREIVGRGSLLYNAQALIGSVAEEITLFRVDMGFLLAMLPPGAFLSLGLLLAVRNWLRRRHTVSE
jgi:electron transport complex protein RnfE